MRKTERTPTTEKFSDAGVLSIIYCSNQSDTGFPVDRVRDHSSDCLTDPERMPDAGRTDDAAQKKCQRKDQDRITAERNHQRRYAFSQTFECPAGSDGYRRYDKSQTDDTKCRASGCDRLRVGGKESK